MKSLIKKYQDEIFYTKNKIEGRDLFYDISKKFLFRLEKWMMEMHGMELDEAKAEAFILCDKIYKNYDKDKCSPIPYLELAFPWHMGMLKDVLNKKKKKRKKVKKSIDKYMDFICQKEYDEIYEEYYLRIPDIFFEERFLCKRLDSLDKQIIYHILKDDFSFEKAAKKFNVSRRMFYDYVNRLRNKIKQYGGYDDIGIREQIHQQKYGAIRKESKSDRCGRE